MKKIGSIAAAAALLISSAFLTGTASAAPGDITLHTPVIAGKFSRAGSTGRQPLNEAALKGLCEQGYTLAMFMYPGANTHTVSCSGGKQIKYMSKGPWESPSGVLATAKNEIDNGGKVLVHCWYGVHAAKFVTAAALNKFCGYSGDQAATYFRVGIPRGSLSESRISQLADKLSAYPSGGQVMGGCPRP